MPNQAPAAVRRAIREATARRNPIRNRKIGQDYRVLNSLNEKQFEDLLFAMIASFTDLLSGPDSVEPIDWDYVQGIDHTIACLTAQFYGVPVETEAATKIIKLDRFLERDERRKWLRDFLATARKGDLG